jgi:Glycine/serine hydroxymethyltransferase
MAKVMMQRGYDVVSGGTDNHLFLVSLLNKKITGKEAEIRLGQANITLNKNTVPGETQSPFVTSGLRIGSPAMTTRGFKNDEAVQVTNWICDILDNIEDDAVLTRVKNAVVDLCARFPVYNGR